VRFTIQLALGVAACAVACAWPGDSFLKGMCAAIIVGLGVEYGRASR
jgi:hypothetical protein